MASAAPKLITAPAAVPAKPLDAAALRSLAGSLYQELAAKAVDPRQCLTVVGHIVAQITAQLGARAAPPDLKNY